MLMVEIPFVWSIIRRLALSKSTFAMQVKVVDVQTNVGGLSDTVVDVFVKVEGCRGGVDPIGMQSRRWVEGVC